MFETNVFGVIAVTQAMPPRFAKRPREASSTCRAPLAEDERGPDEPPAPEVRSNAACPGFTATGLNNFQGTRTVQPAARETTFSVSVKKTRCDTFDFDTGAARRRHWRLPIASSRGCGRRGKMSRLKWILDSSLNCLSQLPWPRR